MNETFSFYLQFQTKNIHVEYNETDCLICFKGWNPVTVLNLLSRARRKINEQVRNKYGEYERDVNIFTIHSINNESYVTFLNNYLYCFVLLDVIFPELHLNAIELKLN